MQIWFGLMVVAVFAAGEGELCNNGCSNGTKEAAWCNKTKRKDITTIERCVDKTRYGEDCASNCKKGKKDYFWCWTRWHVGEHWDYCAPKGKTREGKRCTTACSQNGKDYWWCYTSAGKSEWSYCAPPSKVQTKTLTYTVNGQECIGECGPHENKKYWWCKKSRRWGGKNADPDWDYCSPQSKSSSSQEGPFKGKARTRYNEPCKDECLGRGYSYFWCNTLDNSWDYCSPKVVDTKPVIATGGRPCVGICNTMGESYKWCAVISVHDDSIKGHSSSWWDYCGRGAGNKVYAMGWLPLLSAIILSTQKYL